LRNFGTVFEQYKKRRENFDFFFGKNCTLGLAREKVLTHGAHCYRTGEIILKTFLHFFSKISNFEEIKILEIL